MDFRVKMENYKNKRNFEKRESPDENVIVGRNPVLELLGSDRTVEKLYIQKGSREGSISKIFSLAKERSIVITEVDKRKLDELACGNAHQGVAAIAAAKEYVSIEDIIEIANSRGEKPLIIVCD